MIKIKLAKICAILSVVCTGIGIFALLLENYTLVVISLIIAYSLLITGIILGLHETKKDRLIYEARRIKNNPYPIKQNDVEENENTGDGESWIPEDPEAWKNN